MGYDKNVVSPSAAQKLDCLYELPRLLDDCVDLSGAFKQTLDLLGRRLGVEKAGVSLLNPATGRIQVEAAHGLSPSEASGHNARLVNLNHIPYTLPKE